MSRSMWERYVVVKTGTKFITDLKSEIFLTALISFVNLNLRQNSWDFFYILIKHYSAQSLHTSTLGLQCLFVFTFQVKLAVGWFIALILLAVSTYAERYTRCTGPQCGPNDPNAFFRAVKHSVFGIFVLWIVFVCITGNAGWIAS